MNHSPSAGVTAVAWLVLSMLLCGEGGAQEVGHPLEGTRLRVTVWNTPLPSLATGTLTRVAADTIVLTPPEGPDLIVPLDRILLVERSIRPERPYGGRQGFLIGAGVGVLALWSVIDATSPPDDINLYVSVILGFPLGGLIGAIVGSERAKEKWAPATLNPRPVEPAGR